MALSSGTRLGHYDVTALIGEGGMGQVWQATDTQLNRQVALKILPDAFADDPDRLARFQREAQVLASLNHPGIAAIYGIEEAEGTRALVLELVEGPTLADRIAKGPIPVDDALPIATQIAEALEAAHEAGVIHRDLKPANIKVREDGTVKVLDFGLAKAFAPLSPSGEGQGEGDGLSASPTISLTAAATQIGMVIGTAAYMAPEQAKGHVVDKRADIWAYGAVLFEMLTGRRLFAGADAAEMLAAVLVKEPPISQLDADLPWYVRSVVRRCLARDPKQRLRDIGDARLALAGDVPPPELEHRTPSRSGMAARAGLLLVGGLVVGSLGTALLPSGENPTTPPVSATFRLPLPAPLIPNVGPMMVDISPDGRMLVFAGRDRLYRRELDQLDWQPIPGTENGVDPMFSPDGRWLAFENADGLQRMPAEGGPLATVVEGSAIRGADWATNDRIVYSVPNSGYGQLAVSDDGTLVYLPSGFDERAQREFVWVSRDGSVERLATESRDHRAFDLSPDGSRIAASTDTDIWVYDLLTGASSRLTFGPERSSGPTWMPDGDRVAYTAANLPLSWKAADGTGDVHPVGTIVNQLPTSFTSDGTRAVFQQAGTATNDIGMLSLAEDRSMTWLVDGDFNERDGMVSPDDRWLAYVAQASASDSEVFVRPFPDVEGGIWEVSTGGRFGAGWPTNCSTRRTRASWRRRIRRIPRSASENVGCCSDGRSRIRCRLIRPVWGVRCQ